MLGGFSENFNEICRRQGIQTNVIAELSLNFSTKATYLVDMCSFTRIDLQTLLKVWIRKTVTYYVLKVVKALHIVKNKSIQLDDKVVNYVFNDYPRDRKSYDLLRD